jgi:formylglycine-generating enzyme required for sulfatase activity
MCRLMVVALSALLVGCGNPSGEQTGGVATAISVATAAYLTVDLASGVATPLAVIDDVDLRTNATWKTGTLVFRRVQIGGTVGTVSRALGADTDEPTPRGIPTSVAFIATFELTQAQWTALGGAASWLKTGIRDAGGNAVGATLPAYGLSRVDIETVTAAYSTGRSYRLHLPSNDQWESACRGGTTTLFWWGDVPSDAGSGTAGAPLRALVAENAGGIAGPRAVDVDRVANPAGLYDCHGSLWEWVSDGTGTVRGGSWNDTVPLGRSANRLTLDQDTHHPLVGARLVLELAP